MAHHYEEDIKLTKTAQIFGIAAIVIGAGILSGKFDQSAQKDQTRLSENANKNEGVTIKIANNNTSDALKYEQ